jgi:hypothetical protein
MDHAVRKKALRPQGRPFCCGSAVFMAAMEGEPGHITRGNCGSRGGKDAAADRSGQTGSGSGRSGVNSLVKNGLPAGSGDPPVKKAGSPRGGHPALHLLLRSADRGGTGFAGSDPYTFFNGKYKNLSVSYLRRPRPLDDRINSRLDKVIVDRDFNADFFQKVHFHFNAPKVFGIAFLPAAAHRVGNRHFVDFRVVQSLFYIVKGVGLNIRNNQFHLSSFKNAKFISFSP